MRFKAVLVPFPFDDLTGHKVRPAVCLTDTVGSNRHVVLAFITSSSPTRREASDIPINPASPDHAATGLHVPSTLRLHRMVTVSASIIRRQLGTLPPILQAEVKQRLRALFAL